MSIDLSRVNMLTLNACNALVILSIALSFANLGDTDFSGLTILIWKTSDHFFFLNITLGKIKKCNHDTAQKMKFSIKEWFNKRGQICSLLRLWSHLLKQSLMENFIFAVPTLWSISPSKKVVIPITRLKKDNFQLNDKKDLEWKCY